MNEGTKAALLGTWRELRDDCGATAVAEARGAVYFARRAGLITEDEEELWHRRLRDCPGHDDEGGRDWCAYCGHMPQPRGGT